MKNIASISKGNERQNKTALRTHMGKSPDGYALNLHKSLDRLQQSFAIVTLPFTIVT